jgi:hypothetical protein
LGSPLSLALDRKASPERRFADRAFGADEFAVADPILEPVDRRRGEDDIPVLLC